MSDMQTHKCMDTHRLHNVNYNKNDFHWQNMCCITVGYLFYRVYLTHICIFVSKVNNACLAGNSKNVNGFCLDTVAVWDLRSNKVSVENMLKSIASKSKRHWKNTNTPIFKIPLHSWCYRSLRTWGWPPGNI